MNPKATSEAAKKAAITIQAELQDDMWRGLAVMGANHIDKITNIIQSAIDESEKKLRDAFDTYADELIAENNKLRREAARVEPPTKDLADATTPLTREQPDVETGLLPCPFCGGRAQFGYSSAGWGVVTSAINTVGVWCVACGIFTKLKSFKIHAIETWNRRAPLISSVSSQSTVTRENKESGVVSGENQKSSATAKTPTPQSNPLSEQTDHAL